MRWNLVLLIVLCTFLMGCGTGPSVGQIEAGLNKAVKAKNPEAEARVTSTEVQNQFYVDYKFSCTNCVMEFKDGERHLVPSLEGYGTVTLNEKMQKWKFSSIVLVSPGIGQVVYQSDHIF